MDRAVKSRLAGPGPGADQMVAVMDAVGASSWQVGDRPFLFYHMVRMDFNIHTVHLVKTRLRLALRCVERPPSSGKCEDMGRTCQQGICVKTRRGTRFCRSTL